MFQWFRFSYALEGIALNIFYQSMYAVDHFLVCLLSQYK